MVKQTIPPDQLGFGEKLKLNTGFAEDPERVGVETCPSPVVILVILLACPEKLFNLISKDCTQGFVVTLDTKKKSTTCN